MNYSNFGGALIEEVSNERGVMSDPLGYRKPAREFCDAVHFAVKVLDIFKKDRNLP